MRFYIVDVFAEQKYQGNQLAVLIPEQVLTSEQMQQIAREINFSETTFITSREKRNGGYDVRIFTPDVEVPFAGHPTLGTAFVIQRFLEEIQSERIILNETVGQIPVTFQGEDQEELWMEQKEPAFGEFIPAQVMADILQIGVADINRQYPIQTVSTGLPSVIVPLRTLDAVQACRINHDAYRAFLEQSGRANLLVFTPETCKEENDLHVRVFVDDTGFLEDAATGSANGNLAGYLLAHQFFPGFSLRVQVEQGYAINRPSLIKLDAEKTEGAYRIRVGGGVFLVAKGEWLASS